MPNLSFRNQYTLLLFLSSFLPGQPKRYRTIDLVRLPYLRKWGLSLFIPIGLPQKVTELMSWYTFLIYLNMTNETSLAL